MTIDKYARSRQIDLARSLECRAKIYLDVCFWIIVRDVAAGICTEPAKRELLYELRRGVSRGALVCPISESTFTELMKQRNTASRRMGTARLIDELSLGVSLTTSRSRIATEIGHFFYANSGHGNLYSMQELVWTKLSYTLGYLHPFMSELDEETQLRVQKVYFDEMWIKSLSEIVALVGDREVPPSDQLERGAAEINEGIAAHADMLRSFEQTYRDEIIGAVDACGDLAADVMCAMAEKAIGTFPARGSPQWKETERMCKNVLVAAFAKPTTKQALRTMHIGAWLHANLRWNKNRKFKTNDFFDFEHASAALAYCDAFFTERFLCTLATVRNGALGQINGCRVTAHVDEAIELLRAVA